MTWGSSADCWRAAPSPERKGRRTVDLPPPRRPGERDPIYIWSRRRLEARLDLSATKQERVPAAQEHLDEMKAAERPVACMYQSGQIDLLARIDFESRRLEAESWLERENGRA